LGAEDKYGICRICGKPNRQSRTFSPLEDVCSSCWENAFGFIGRKKKEKWEELLTGMKQELSKSKELLTNSAVENQRLCSANNRISELEKKVVSLSAKLAEMRFNAFGIETLYHITPIANIPSIFQHGLLSYNQVLTKGLDVNSSSNPDIQWLRDSMRVGDRPANDYVPLFFSERNGTLAAMEYDEKNLGRVIVYICIKREILEVEGVWFTDGNVASGRKTRQYCNLEDLEKLDWNTIREEYQIVKDDEEKKRIKAAEVLVPFRIDHSWFQKLIVPDEEAKSSLKELLPSPMTVQVEPDFYFTSRGKRGT
jgi:hypothetical protein